MTNDPERAERLRVLRMHGSKPKYYHHVIGGNFRLDTIQAAIVTVKLQYLDQWTDGRRHNASQYNDALRQLNIAPSASLTLPSATTSRHVYNQYVIRVPQRDALQVSLSEQLISTAVYYPLCLHQQTCFTRVGHSNGDFPVAEQCTNDSLAIPVFPELEETQVARTAQRIAAFMSPTST